MKCEFWTTVFYIKLPTDDFHDNKPTRRLFILDGANVSKARQSYLRFSEPIRMILKCHFLDYNQQKDEEAFQS